MKVSIGLPNAVPGTTGAELVEWARRAESAGFASPAAAAVTERIGLATTILIAPYRVNAASLAKQAASIQVISDGRLTLGVAVGGRENDYEASGVDFDSRGERFDEMLERMTSIWAESAASSGAPGATAVGPDVAANPPQLVLGGSIDRAFERAAKYGAGWIMGGGTPEMFADGKARLERAWSAAGREGTPRTMALAYYSLGERAEENAKSYLEDYYAWLGPYAEQISASAAKDADTVRGYVEAFSEAGCDELVLFPSASGPEQVDLLAEAAL